MSPIAPTRRAGFRRTRQRGRLALIVTLVVAVLLAATGVAFAFFNANTNINLSAQADSLSAPTAPTASADSSSQITVGWTLPGSQLTGAEYEVTRTSGPGSPHVVCTVASSSCPDTGLNPSTTYGYEVIALLNNWQTTPVTVSASTALKLVFTAQPTGTIAGVSVSPSVAVSVENDGNGVISGDNGTQVHIAIGTNPSSGTLSGTVTKTVVNGVATFDDLSIDKAGTGYTLTATDTTGTSGHPYTTDTSSSFNISHAAATTIAVSSGNSQSETVNTQFTNPLVALVSDPFGNPVPGATVTFTVPGSGASVTFAGGVNTATTDASGLATSSAFTANTTAGAYNIAASASGTNTVNFSEDNTASTGTKLVITSTAFTATASNSAATPFTTTLEDQFGNPTTSGSPVTVNLASSSAGKKFAATSGGTAVTTVTLPASTRSVTAYYADTVADHPVITVSATGLSPDGTQTETINPGPAVTFTVSGYPTPVIAGTQNSFTVTAKDTFGNIATGYTGTVHFSSNDGQAILPANYTFVAGDSGTHAFSATLETGGTNRTITANDTVTASITGTQNQITVSPATAASFTVSGFTSPTVAGVSHPFTVTAKDPFGNVATGYTGTVQFTSSDPQSTLPANYTFVAGDNGVHTTFSAMLKTAGTQSITATDTVTSSITGTQTGITVNAAAAAIIAVSSGNSQTTTVNTTFTNPLVAFVTDAFGNPISGATVTFTAPASGTGGTVRAASNGGACLASGGSSVASCTATANAGGLASSLTFKANTVAGPYNVSAHATGTNTVNFSETNTADVGAKLVITSGAWSATASPSATNAFTTTLEDTFGNPTTSASPITINLASTSGGATFAATSGGEAATSVTLPASTQSVTAYYADTVAGNPVITVSNGALTPNGTQTETITAAAPNKFAFTSVPVSGAASASATLGPITVQERDQFGNPANAGVGGTVVNLASNTTGTAKFAATSGGASVTQVTIPSGSSSVNLFYGDTKAGAPTITASGALTSATQQETITASKLAVISSAVTGTASTTATLGPITVQLRDETNAAVNAPTGGTIVTLSSNSTGTAVFAATSGGSTVTQVTIPAGSSSANFFYGDTKAGTPTITASSTGLTSGTQDETINAAAASVMTLTNCVVQGSAQACNGTYALGNGGSMTAKVTVTDAFANVPPNTTVSMNVTSASPTTYSVSGSPATITNGTVSTTFTIQKIGNVNNSTTITIHATTGSYADLTFTVRK